MGPDPPVGVAGAKPWGDASSEARSVAEYIMLVAAANTRGYMVRGLMWEVQPCVERRGYEAGLGTCATGGADRLAVDARRGGCRGSADAQWRMRGGGGSVHSRAMLLVAVERRIHRYPPLLQHSRG